MDVVKYTGCGTCQHWTRNPRFKDYGLCLKDTRSWWAYNRTHLYNGCKQWKRRVEFVNREQ